MRVNQRNGIHSMVYAQFGIIPSSLFSSILEMIVFVQTELNDKFCPISQLSLIVQNEKKTKINRRKFEHVWKELEQKSIKRVHLQLFSQQILLLEKKKFKSWIVYSSHHHFRLDSMQWICLATDNKRI